MPPIAAATGTMAFLKLDNSPWSSSRLISSPTMKKKIAMRPSLTRCSRSSEMAKTWMSKEMLMCQKSKYDSDHGELAQPRAAAAATIRMAAPTSSVWM